MTSPLTRRALGRGLAALAAPLALAAPAWAQSRGTRLIVP